MRQVPPGSTATHSSPDTRRSEPGSSSPLRLSLSPAPNLLQRKCSCESAAAPGVDDKCPQCRGLSPSDGPILQRKPLSPREPGEGAAAGGLIVDDEALSLTAGQMRKGPFLELLRADACRAADLAMAASGHSTTGCPYVEKIISNYQGADARHLERAIWKYAPEARGANSARDYLPLVSARVAAGAAQWARTGRLPADVPSEMVSAAMGGGLLGMLASGLGGLFSAIGSLFSKADGAPAAAVDHAALGDRLGPGRSLEGESRGRMERAFGHDFGAVRIHADDRAADLSRDLHARAFTVGNHVAFGRGQFRPGDPVGDALIAHELAHVVQQGGGSAVPSAPVEIAAAGTPLEAEADQAAEQVVASLWSADQRRPSLPKRGPALRVQRCSETPKTTAPTMEAPKQPVQQASKPAPAKPTAAPDAWLKDLPFAEVRKGAKPGDRVEGRFEDSTGKTFVAKGPLTEFSWDATIDVSKFDPTGPTPRPGFKYRKDAGKELASDELPTSPARDAAAAAVAEARKNISARFFVPRNEFRSGVGQIRGLEWSGQAAVLKKLAASGRTKEIELNKSYQDWLKTTMADKAAGTKGSGTPLTDPGAVRKIMRAGAGAEGEPSSINAWDRANVTWGAGLTGKLFPKLLASVMNKSAEAKAAFIAAGITVEDKELVVADPSRKWKLRGVDAELYLRAHPELLSLFVNIAQGVVNLDDTPSDAMRMAVLDAQIEIIQRVAGMLSAVSFANESARITAFHAVWGGLSPNLFVSKQAAVGRPLTQGDVLDAISGKASPQMKEHMKTP